MGKQVNIETYAPQLLLDSIDGRSIDASRLLKDLRLDFGWTESGGSWNHQQMLMAAALWNDPNDKIIDLWLMYLQSQLGESTAGAVPKNYPMLGYFNGTEQYSNTYEGWRWGSVLAVRLLALIHPKHPASKELLRLTAKYSEVQTALLSLGASPGPTLIGSVLIPDGESEVRPHTHRTGKQTWWSGPSLPMSGARSTPAHLGTDERMPLYCFHSNLPNGVGLSDIRMRWDWPAEILVTLIKAGERPPIHTREQALKDIKLLVPHHFLYWRDEEIRLNYMERLANGNTTSIMFHVHYEKENRAVYGFPWPGRLRGGLGESHVEYRSSPSEVIAESRFGTVHHQLPSRTPDTHSVMGPLGLLFLR